jgi:hypothetical protein
VSTLQVICGAQLAMLVANLGQIPTLSTNDRSVPVAFNELALAAILLGGLHAVIASRSFRLNGVALTAVAFVLIGGGSAVWSVQRFEMSGFDLLIALAYLARWVAYFGTYLVVINVVHVTETETVWGALETMLVCFAAFGVLQSAFLPDFALLIYPESRLYVDWDPQGHRLVSTVLEPNIAGGMLMIGLLVQVARVSTGSAVPRARIFLLFLALMLTISRSALLGFIFGLGVILLARGLSRRVLQLGLVAGVLVVLASPFLIQYGLAYNKFSLGAGTSAGARLESWLLALQIVADYPVFGVGFNAFKYAAASYGSTLIGGASYSSDGGLLFIAATTGVIGLTVYCLMLFQVLRTCQRAWRDLSIAPESRGLAIGTAAATVAVVVQSAFVNAILTTFIMQMLWLLWGLVFVATQRRAATSVPTSATPRVVALAA